MLFYHNKSIINDRHASGEGLELSTTCDLPALAFILCKISQLAKKSLLITSNTLVNIFTYNTVVLFEDYRRPGIL
jgi:hypothetical protein